jgi:excinuclease ABC subunit C
MRVAAAKKQFEKAARLRDQLNSLKLLDERQTVILAKKVDWDIVSMASSDGYACINLFKVREGKLRDKENFVYEIANTDLRMEFGSTDDYGSGVLQKFLEQYYSETSGIPKIIYTQYQTREHQLVEKLIRSRFNRAVKIITPQKGKAKELVKLGTANAREYLGKWLSDQAGHLDKINLALEGLKNVLKLSDIPRRIECYDISNIQGTNAVGSMVVFNDGLPAKSQYRKFKIRSKSTPDDFAMMKEMLTRRLSRLQYSPPNIEPAPDLIRGGVSRQTGRGGISKAEKLPPPPRQVGGTPPVPGGEQAHWPTPDLIVIDGGKGQLGIAVETINNSQFTINVIGLAKRIEEIFLPHQSYPIILNHDDPALQLLQRLRDEAHRFGITFHRQLRSKQAVKSALDDIPGIGPKTKKLLKQKFGTVADIRKAKFEDLVAVVGERITQAIKASL